MQKQLSTNMDLLQNLGAELETKEKTIQQHVMQLEKKQGTIEELQK
jgi:hypothetical protein